MNVLSQKELEIVQGGSWRGFCKGLTGVTVTVGLGVALGLFSNPLTGTGATLAGVAVATCWLIT